MNAHSLINQFEVFRRLGYEKLVPIVPPGAPISDRSSIAKRLAAGKDDRGKTPGMRNAAGFWHGFDWLPHEATPEDLVRWHLMGAGIGIKTGRLDSSTSLVLIDADTMNPEHARLIREAVHRHFGVLPVRIGRDPKAGYMARVRGELRYCRIEFGPLNDKGRLVDRVEILSDGRQFVAHGIHPATQRAYHWPNGVPALDDVPIVEAAALTAFLEDLRGILPAATPIRVEGASAENVNQEALRADPELVERAVRATPNTSAHFPSREDWRDFGYMIKAAMGPALEAQALALFQDWSDGWVGEAGEVNDPGYVEAEWSRFKPPFKAGAGKLFELAEQASGGAFNRAAQWFEQPVEGLSWGGQDDEETEAKRPIRLTPYSFTPASLIPMRQSLYAGHFTRKYVSVTVAPSKVGKTALAIAEALAMVSGKPLLGVQPAGQLRVSIWNGEDPLEELERRVAAAMMHYGLTREDVGDRLFLDSGRDMEIVLAQDTRDGARICEPVVEAFSKTLLENRIDVGIVDPFISSHRVSENDNGAIDMVAKKWAKIADRTNTSIELIHHVRKLNGAEITVEDGRGAVALLAASRSARALAKMSKIEATRLGVSGSSKRFFRFADTSSNLALPADETVAWMALESVALGNGPGDGADRLLGGDSVGVVTTWAPDPAIQEGAADEKAAALALIRAGAWRSDVRAGDEWVGVPVGQAYGLDRQDEADKGRIKAVLSGWFKSGVLVEEMRRDAHRKMRAYAVVASALEPGGVFD